MKKLLEIIKPSLLTRLALTLGLVGLVPVALLSYRLVGINNEAMKTQVELTQTRSAGTVAARIDAEISTFRYLAEGLAGHRALADPRSSAAQELMRSSLDAYSRRGVLSIAVVNPEGEQVIMAQLQDEDSRARVRRALELPVGDAVQLVVESSGESSGDSPETPRDGSPPPVVDLRVAAPLPERRGFVWLVADGSVIRSAVDEPEQVGREAELTLAHRQGRALLGSLETYPAEMLEYAFNPNVEGVESSFRTPDGEVIGAYSPLDTASWTVLSRQHLAAAHEVAERMERESLYAVGLVGIGVLLISALAYTTTVRPIRQLAAAQRRLAGGAAIAGGNEIDQLKASFEALEERLKDRSALDEVFLGRYQVRDVIGSGAMGTVFLGHDPKLQRPVALKTIRLDQRLGAEQREELLGRLLQEAITTAKFNHPNIVAIYDVEDRGGSAFMAMEYVDGDSLESVVWRRGKLEVGEVTVIGAAIARGLAAAHEHELVHRDVKPANILLGKDKSIKVTDFGISELLSSMSEREDVVFGTPGYLPPESLQGKGYDASGDLFSLGAVLYFCLTGRRPFEGKTIKEVIRKTLFGTVTPPSKREMGISPALDALVMSLLSSDMKRRPRDAATIADRLERMARENESTWEPRTDDLTRSLQEEHEATAASFVPTTKLDQV